MGDGSIEDGGAPGDLGGAGAAGSGPVTEDAAVAPYCDAAIGGCGCGGAIATSGAWLHAAAKKWSESSAKSSAAPLACAASAAGKSEAAEPQCTPREASPFEDGGAMQAADEGGAADAAHGADALLAYSARLLSNFIDARLRAQMCEDV